jgi:hypothetical protein
MALKLEKLDGWQIIYSEQSSGAKVLWDVTGDGTQFEVPAGVVEIRKRSFQRGNVPALKQVTIPESVKVIGQGAFDGFGPDLEIRCACQYKPEGFFEGEYGEDFTEDGTTYHITHYGSWLRRSVVLRSRDSDGRLTWMSTSSATEISDRPTVLWGCTND